MKRLPLLSEADAAFIRGFVAACAEFHRRPIEPKRMLNSANITMELAKLSGVTDFDLEELRGKFAGQK